LDHSVIRTFRGANAREALSAAKAALGPDAVVLEARELPGGLFRAPQYEVMAALDDAALEKRQQPQGRGAGRGPPARAAAAPPAEAEPAGEPPPRRLRYQELPLHQGGPQEPHQLGAREPEPPPRAPAPAPRKKGVEVAGLPLDEMAGELGELRAALDEARALLGAVAAGGRALSGLAAAADEVHQCLVHRGMDPAQATHLIKEALHQGTPLKALPLFGAVRDLLQAALVTDRAPWLKRTRQAIALVGPTGVGKTTTLAKIAARALMEGQRRVGLVTVDTYRIGASEQLLRYGEIMGVPAFVVKGRAELTAAMERLGQCDLVLIDTAGRSQNDQVQRQAELVRTVPAVELHLVVSAASGARDLAAAAERFRPLRPERLIVSKLDEAVAPAGFLSATTALAVPVSCVCNGQRVPEDIHGVTRSDLVDLVLGSGELGS
jgi:flagellar biosynthesis protein FlhF